MDGTVPNPTRLESGHSVQILLAAFLITAALYFARPLFEPIAFAFFGMALVWLSVVRTFGADGCLI